MLTGVHHVAYVVADMDEAIAFIERSMGVKVSRRATLTEFEMATFKVGDSRLELIRPIQPDSQYTEFLKRTGGGLNHVAFASDDIEADAERMKKAGVGYDRMWKAETSWYVTNVDSDDVYGMRLQLAREGEGED